MPCESEIMQRLLATGIENSRFEAQQLMRAFSDERALDAAVSRRVQGYPLQYLIGEWDFYRQTYRVSEDCLIPRADTELLVEKALLMMPPNAHFLDLCTGSGCVAISTLCTRVDLCATAVDLFDKTLAVARENAQRNGVTDRITLFKTDVLCDPPNELSHNRYDAILANPPYIRKKDMEHLQSEVRHEPYAALCGGEDGLDFYRAIIKRWTPLLKEEGFLLFEIGYDQAESLCRLAKEHGFFATVWRDLGGNDRVVALKK